MHDCKLLHVFIHLINAMHILRVEGLKEEVAVLSESTPLFSFVPPSAPAGVFGFTQQSYRITVSKASGPTGHETVGAPLWDSGDVASQKTLALVCPS
jgi:hypothetical protein